MKRTPLTRTTRLQARTRLNRTAKLRAVNTARKRKELARCYGPADRRAWVKAQPCVACGRGPCDNAHGWTDGMGRKADYTAIVPLCAGPDGCHRKYDTHRAPFDTPRTRLLVAAQAELTEARWQRHLLRVGR